MKKNKHTLEDLKMLQALPLDIKVQMTRYRIRSWINEFGVNGVYVAFSGGKDSTVLLDIVRRDYPEVEAVFVDTGLEYPEIRDFVKTFENVTWLKPKMQFKEVIKKYGYPFISKEVSNNVDGARKYIKILTEQNRTEQNRTEQNRTEQNRTEQNRFRIPTTTEEYVELANMLNRDWGKVKGSPRRLAIILGMLSKDGKAIIPSKDRSMFSMEKYKFLLDSPFLISDMCCRVMKKAPAHEYHKLTGKNPIIATMTSESRLRMQKWLQNGCNGFNMKIPTSTPMSFWTEQDVLLYIKKNNLSIASVYGDIVYTDDDGMEYTEPLFIESMPLKTTGCDRTGCMFCGYGCHFPEDKRFLLMKHTHPATYEWIMKPWEEGGLNYKAVIDWINENGNLNIKY